MIYKRARPKKHQMSMVISQFVHRLYLDDEYVYKLKLSFYNPTIGDVSEWCSETFEQIWKDWAIQVYGSQKLNSKKPAVIYYFKTKEDAMAFKLRWS